MAQWKKQEVMGGCAGGVGAVLRVGAKLMVEMSSDLWIEVGLREKQGWV